MEIYELDEFLPEQWGKTKQSKYESIYWKTI